MFEKMRIAVVLLLFLNIFICNGQNVLVQGQVSDINTNEPLAGVYLIINESNISTSNEKGMFKFLLLEGEYTIEVRFLGYKTERINLIVKQYDKNEITVKLQPESEILDEVVVSASKYEQKKSDLSISTEVIKPALIEKSNALSIENILQKASGVVILEKQASIRGGSGYTYGAGSRVLMLLDDLPLMTGGSGEAVWDLIPVENIAQIEIVKGASSALYGSSALNGLINIRTASATIKPITKFNTSFGYYGTPKDRYKKWWANSVQHFGNFQFFHSKKINQFDFTLSGYYSEDEGYRQNDSYRKGRIYSKIQYIPQRINTLRIGTNILYMAKEGENFFLWENGDTGVFKISPTFRQNYSLQRMVFDPYITYFKNDNFHNLKFRYYRVINTNNTMQSNDDRLLLADYRYQRLFKSSINFNAGGAYSHFTASSELYGTEKHIGTNAGVFLQLDKKFEKLNVTFGLRYELYSLDSLISSSKPVVRIGVNYKLYKYANLRISFGQGFRYPTIAEKYTQTQVGNLRIFPNNNLNPENGWSFETGFIQGLKFGDFKGYFDFAAFLTQYYNMTEFMFGIYNPNHIPLNWNPTSEGYVFNWIGFSAVNAEKARIPGIESILNLEGKLYCFDLSTTFGYTFIYPISLNNDTIYKETFSDSDSKILKYRNLHQFKMDSDIEFENFNIGFSIIYNSKIVNIDKAFENLTIKINNVPITLGDYILPGLADYREKNKTGFLVFDARLQYTFLQNHKLTFVVRNVFNREYMLRPGDVQAPVNYSLQYSIKI